MESIRSSKNCRGQLTWFEIESSMIIIIKREINTDFHKVMFARWIVFYSHLDCLFRISAQTSNLFLDFYYVCSLHESLLSVTGVRCTDLVLSARERSLLWYRRVLTLQVYTKVSVFQLDRWQSVLYQGQQRELSNRCWRVSFPIFLRNITIPWLLDESFMELVSFLAANLGSGWTVICIKVGRSPAARMATSHWRRVKILSLKH